MAQYKLTDALPQILRDARHNELSKNMEITKLNIVVS